VLKSGDAFVDTKTFSRERARPLAPEDRREAILDAVIPLLRERGRDVSTRQLAEAAGVAEGTLFRAFGDKESIIRAAIDRIMDPSGLRDRLRAIDPDEPSEDKVRQVLVLLRGRFAGVVAFVTAMQLQGPPTRPHQPEDGTWLDIVSGIFRQGELAVPVETLAFYLRLVAFGTAIPVFNAPYAFTDDELAGLVLHGVMPRSAGPGGATGRAPAEED